MRREDNVLFQGEIRSGKGLVVGELHMSPNSSKASQAKQMAENRPVKSVCLKWAVFPCFSPALLGMAECPWARGKGEGSGSQVLKNYHFQSDPSLTSWQGFTSSLQRTPSSLYVHLLMRVNTDHSPCSLSIKTLDRSQTWVICKRRWESHFEHFWSTNNPSENNPPVLCCHLCRI